MNDFLIANCVVNQAGNLAIFIFCLLQNTKIKIMFFVYVVLLCHHLEMPRVSVLCSKAITCFLLFRKVNCCKSQGCVSKEKIR